MAKKAKKTAKKVIKKVTKKATKKVSKKASKKTKSKSDLKTKSKSKVKKLSKVKPLSKVQAKAKPKDKVSKVSKSKVKITTKAIDSKQTQKLRPSDQARLQLGQVVPDFEAMSTSGPFKLSNFKGKNVVLYFYPKDNTSGCTLEGHDFTKSLPEFEAKNTVVFGISKDTLKSHQGFIEKQNYKHHLITDENEKICQLFGVIQEKSMYGRKYMGIDRSTFVIDANGMLKSEWRNVKVDGHVAQVLSSL